MTNHSCTTPSTTTTSSSLSFSWTPNNDANNLLQHFVFGYGSLICANSRAVTAPETGDKLVTPVIVQGLERTWAKRTNRGMTAMGVRFVKEGECVGVLVPVSEDELSMFDQREVGYDRILLNPDTVDVVPFLDDQHYNADDHQTFLDRKEHAKDTLRIWVYVQCDPKPPTPEHPIVQTYVDTILRGCLDISEEFAAEFIATTKGWHPEEFQEIEEFSDCEEIANCDSCQSSQGGYWVDDRHDPIYIRGDPAYSRRKAKELDRLLKQSRPHHLRCRQPLRRSE